MSINKLRKLILNPGFWFILALLVLITLPHYREVLKHPAFINELMVNLGLTRHTFERILYLAPIVWAGFIFGWRGAVATSLVALACMLPIAILASPSRSEAILETSAVFLMGNIVAISFDSLRKEREQRAYLAALNQTAGVVSQSLELDQILNSSLTTIMDVIDVDAGLVYLLDSNTAELTLTTYKGVSGRFVQEVDRLKLGEGFNGLVAKTDKPLLVEDAAQDPSLTRAAVSEENIHSQLIVPLRSKAKVVGTLCVAMHSRRRFKSEEIDLLSAIGSQIGIAIENARLYQEQQEIAEQLRASEARYRQLFENAHDAIWLHDLDGNIIAANQATAQLFGFTTEELLKMNVKTFLSENSLRLANEIRRKLLNSEYVDQPYEQQLVRQDGTQATLMLTTNLLVNDSRPVAFQNLARDITEEKRMQENLRSYLHQATRAQEEERKRISRELHDDTIQALVVLSRQLDALSSRKKELSEEDSPLLEKLRQQTNSIIQGVRRLSQDLRPAALDRLGLLPALEWLASEVTEFSGIATKVNVIGNERRLPEEIELVLFRITQEALRNVWRHSQATTAEVTVQFERNLTRITVADNGKGFNLPGTMGDLAREGKLGLAGMQERAGLIGATLTVHSAPNQGSTMTIDLPL
ncbi:MAG: PAS domain S-box protein [Chloroflexota bacterium]